MNSSGGDPGGVHFGGELQGMDPAAIGGVENWE